MTDERAEFEEWAKQFGFPDVAHHQTAPSTNYRERDLTMAWQGWQAAMSSSGRSELLEALKDCAKFMEMDLPFDVYLRARPEIEKARSLIKKHTKEQP